MWLPVFVLVSGPAFDVPQSTLCSCLSLTLLDRRGTDQTTDVCLLLELLLEFLPRLRSQRLPSAEEFPRFLLALEALFLLRASSSAVLISSKVLKLHACKRGSHPGSVLVSCFDKEAQRLVGHGGCLLSLRG